MSQPWDLKAPHPGVAIQQDVRNLPNEFPVESAGSNQSVSACTEERLHRAERAGLAGAGKRQISVFAGDRSESRCSGFRASAARRPPRRKRA